MSKSLWSECCSASLVFNEAAARKPLDISGGRKEGITEFRSPGNEEHCENRSWCHGNEISNFSLPVVFNGE
eukprot:764817-Hanusia_phi.AAC.5